MKILLDKNKKFFKANLHCHTTNSDGKYPVEFVKEQYKKQGYSIVAFTDHEHLIDNSFLNDDECLTITSCEVAIKEFPNLSTLVKHDMRVCHLNFYALDSANTVTPCYSSIYDHYVTERIKPLVKHNGEYNREYSAQGINEIIRIANKNGFLVTYNHPTWSLENANDYLSYENLFAVEVYNNSCALTGRLDDEHAFDDMLRAGKRLYCVCADDNHNLKGMDAIDDDSFGGWVQINADKLDYTTIMNALKKGDFYSSTGPEIYSLTVDGDKIRIETSPCTSIYLTNKSRRSQYALAKKGESITSAEFSLDKVDEFFRIRVVDERGKKALTQAYYKNELL